VDGLKGFPEAITAAFPDAMVQTCIVHLVRHSLNFCSWKDRKIVAAVKRTLLYFQQEKDRLFKLPAETNQPNAPNH